MQQQSAQAVPGAISEATGTQRLPVRSRRLGEIPEIVWGFVSDDSTWMIDGLGPVRVSAQIARTGYIEIRAFIGEIARTFGSEHIRDVMPPFPDRELMSGCEPSQGR